MAKARIDVMAGVYFGSGSATCQLAAYKGGKWGVIVGSRESWNTRKNGFCALTSGVVNLYPKTRVRFVRAFHPGGGFQYEGTWADLLAALPVERREYKFR